mgnify:CR=1 FL=1
MLFLNHEIRSIWMQKFLKTDFGVYGWIILTSLISQLLNSTNLLHFNTLALENNHDYLQHSHSDNWLRVMNITEISNEDIVITETRTHGQSSNQLWWVARPKRIHSYNFGKICKATNKTDMTPLATNLTKHTPKIFAPAILHVKCYESIALQEF